MICIIFFSSGVEGQGIKFRDDYWLEKAIQIAQIEDKIIFIDTYTPWCGPCKLMDIQFQDPTLSEYFNAKFINIKINMDSPYGESVKMAYDVFFLPTLLLLDKHGNVKYASEGTMTSDELLAIASFHHNAIYNPSLTNNSTEFVAANENPTVPPNKPVKATSLPPTPQNTEILVASNTTKKQGEEPDIAEESIAVKESIKPVESVGPTKKTGELLKEEKILYTQNDASTNPEFLYNLTYLKLQLQDGTQWATAEKYLATQKDWTTKKNMKFIYDFVRRPGTKMFDHLINNRLDYEILFGKDNVNRSISIMVNMRLNQGFPRPDFEEALQLYALLDPEVAEQATYSYILERYEMEENYSKYVEYALKYIKEIDGDDFSVINSIGMYYENSGQSTISLNEMVELVEHAIEIQGGTYYKLYDTLAGLYFKMGKKKKALRAIEKALELAKNSGVPLEKIEQLQRLIQSL